jgi:hypothetical protein
MSFYAPDRLVSERVPAKFSMFSTETQTQIQQEIQTLAGPITRGKPESGMLFAHKKSKLKISYVRTHFSILNLQSV